MLLSACMFTAMNLLRKQSMNHGFGYCRSWEVGLYLTSEMVFTAIAGIVLFGDSAGWRFWTGGALILGSAVAAPVQRSFPWSQSGG
jgi:hypothetical protein